MKKEKLYEYKKIKLNGAIHHFIKTQNETSFKYHNWEGPAIEPINNDSPLSKKYFLFGIEYTKDKWEEIKKEQEGLPWFK
jgi:hypothetical protein